jgi:4-amino-4-deoxy-L-arabinose transferase-like glycosyltransferase
MVAFFPQDIFFAITGDVLSPVVFAAAFFMLLEICLNEKSWYYHLLTGLLVAAAFLTKASNIAILALAAAVFLIKIKQAVSQKRLKQYLPSLSAFATAGAIPIVLWLGRNYILFGDAIGAAKSIEQRTWTLKPFGEMFNHPILTPSGLFYFLTELSRTFWRGEFVWHFKRIASGFMDWFYIISSAVFLTVSCWGFIFEKTRMDPSRRGPRSPRLRREASVEPRSDKPCRACFAAGLFVIILSVMFLAVMSMRYDFGQCFYPSREEPYFTSGRLIAGTILPFLVLYIDGLRRILAKLRCASCLLIVVSVIVVTVTISEIVLTWPVFASPYNWFHIG